VGAPSRAAGGPCTAGSGSHTVKVAPRPSPG